MNPKTAHKYFKNFIFEKHFSVKGFNKIESNNENVSYPILSEFGIHKKFNFHVIKWHDKFDALIGSEDFEKLGAKINYETYVLEIKDLKIPFFMELNSKNFVPCSQLAKTHATIPVNIDNGQVIIPELIVNNYCIPESIAIAKNGFCTIPIEEDREIQINFLRPIEVDPIINIEMNQKPNSNFVDLNISNVIRTQHLNSEEKQNILGLCQKYKDIFYNENCDLSFTNAVKHKIRTTDDEPVYRKSFRYPHHLKSEIQNQIRKLLDNKIIRPSISPFSSPVWIVPKKIDASGKKKWRLVIDYRKLNDKTVEDKYPLPRIEEILDNLGKCTYFSTLDLAQGFHQIELHPDSIEKTAFTVDNGHWEYVRMPFGLKNAPSTFQRVMDNVLREYLYKFCFVYMDDVVIFSKSLHEHLIHLNKIFDKFREFNLKVQLDKSEFLCKEVAFLGHIITPNGIKPNPEKIKAIQAYPLPKSVKEIRAFLGLIGYYRRFIQNFAKVVQPFTKCLKKGAKIDQNNGDYLQAFHNCKELIMNAPILTYPDFNKTFRITTDSSNFAIGGVLSQNNKPIAFYSRTLNSAERNYSTIERELLGIVENTKHFRPYIFGKQFIIETDHKPLVWLFSLKDPNSRLVKWRLRLEEFDYKIQYKKGKENSVADALSRIEINANETTDDDMLDLLSMIPNVEDEPDLTAEDLDELLVDGIRQNEPENTQHTAHEDPVFTMPITDKPINQFNYRIILKLGDQFNVKLERPFSKYNYIVTIRRGNEIQNLSEALKDIINPTNMYCIYFQDELLESKFLTLTKHLFDNKVKIIKSNIAAKDLVKPDDQYNVVHEYHSSNHNGILETYINLKSRYYWPDMKSKINQVINDCETCMLSKYDRNPYKVKFSGPLLAKRPFDIIHIDTFSFEGNKFLTIIDLFSRYTQAYFIIDGSGISMLNKLRHYCSHHSYPRKIVCDEGKEFKNKIFEEFCSLFKIELHFTTNYNSSSNSPVERVHSTILEKLRTLKIQNESENPQNLMISAILIYNQSIHSATGHTPFTLLYGPFENLNAHAIDMDKTVYEIYNEKRKNEILPFYEQLYQKQLRNGTRILENRNKNKETDIEFNEPTAYFKKQQIRKTDPCYEKVNVTSVDKNKIQGIREKSKRPANTNLRKVRRIKKSFPLQNHGTDQSDPGPSNRKDQH